MFSAHCLDRLVLLEGILEPYGYLSTVPDQEEPNMLVRFPECDGIFQQNNATRFTVRIVRAWFENHKPRLLHPWLPSSPYLNRTEHDWNHFDRHIKRMDPSPWTPRGIWYALESAWVEIPFETIRQFMQSLPRPLATVHTEICSYSGYIR